MKPGSQLRVPARIQSFPCFSPWVTLSTELGGLPHVRFTPDSEGRAGTSARAASGQWTDHDSPFCIDEMADYAIGSNPLDGLLGGVSGRVKKTRRDRNLEPVPIQSKRKSA